MRHNLGLFNALLTIAVVTAILAWMVISLTNNDPLWFIKSFKGQAETIIIYWDGEQHILQAGEPGYLEIMQAFAEGIAHPGGFEWAVGFSEENIRRYREDFKLLEMRFPVPVQVHTRHPFPETKTFLIPLDKTHAKWRRAFAFTGVMPYTNGPLNLTEDNFIALYNAVETAIDSQ